MSSDLCQYVSPRSLDFLVCVGVQVQADRALMSISLGPSAPTSRIVSLTCLILSIQALLRGMRRSCTDTFTSEE